jgi:GT2 family glycosyltransferase
LPQVPTVVAVVLTLNQKADTLRCLRSFQAVAYPELEIVIVDNGSEDGTVEAVRTEFPNVRLVVRPENEGAAQGRNRGIDYANEHIAYDYLLFVDNDTEAAPNFLSLLVEDLEQYPQVGFGSPKIYQMEGENVLDDAGGCDVNFYTGSTAKRGYGEVDRGQYDIPVDPRRIPAGPCVLVRRAVIDKCDGYDVAYDPFGLEDLDFTLRGRRHGFTFRFVPGAHIYHKGNRTGFTGYDARFAAVKGRNLRRFVRRHATPFQRFCFNALLPVLGVRTVLREAMRGNFAAPYHLIRAYLSKRA